MPFLERVPRGLEWLRQAGLTEDDLRSLVPALPGEFTLFDTYYVNSGTPQAVFVGTGEGSLPMVAGRWYILPSGVAQAHANLVQGAQPLANAPRLAR